MSIRLPQSVDSQISIFWNGDCTSSSLRVTRKPMDEPVGSKRSCIQVGAVIASLVGKESCGTRDSSGAIDAAVSRIRAGSTEGRAMAAWSPDQARRTYSIPHWSAGYYDVDGGEVVVRPNGAGGPVVSLPAVVDAALSAGGKLPLLLRFPGILRDRLASLQAAFAQAQADLGYTGGYHAADP